MPNRTALSVPRTQASYAYPLGVLRNRPYAYFRLNEAAGRGIVNLVTGKTLANAYSASGVTYGVAGGFASDPSTGVQFDGVAGNATLPLITTQQTNVSLECRLWLPTANSIGTAMHVGIEGGGYGLGVGGTNFDNSGTQLIVELDGNAWEVSGVNLAIMTWLHCVWTFAAPNTHTFFVAGSQVAQFAANAMVLPTTNNFIGSSGGVSFPRYSNFRQTDCAFYNYVLSPAQVAAQALLAV